MYLISKIFFISITVFHCAFTFAEQYYIDCYSGNDANSGSKVIAPWKTINRLNSHSFRDGDEIFFKKDCVWEDVSIKISNSLYLGSYGESGSRPKLLGVRKIYRWKSLHNNIYVADAEIEKNIPAPKELRIVIEREDVFYKEASGKELVDDRTFYYDLNNKKIYVKTPSEFKPNRHGLYVASKPHVIELQKHDLQHLHIKGLDIRFANEYGVGFWYQGGGTNNGSIIIEDNLFWGNGYQSIHIAGNNTFDNVDIINNIFMANGHEAIYIGYVGPIPSSEHPYTVKNLLRISGNQIGGNDFGWRSYGPMSAANGDGIDIKRGVFKSLITNNIIRNIEGYYAIGMLSSNAVIQNNIIRNVHLLGADKTTNVSGIYLDPDDDNGTINVNNNILNMVESHGIVFRGNGDMDYSINIENNEISIEDENYAHFAFTSQSRKNTLITSNKLIGGTGLIISKKCCPIKNVVVEGNTFNNVKHFVESNHSISGMHINFNKFCLDLASIVEDYKYNTLPDLFKEYPEFINNTFIKCLE